MAWSQYDLARAIVDYIKSQRPGVSVGVSRFDTEDAPLPGVLAYPIGVTEFDGGMDNDDMGTCRIQITCIGSTEEQAAGMQAGVYRMLLAQTGSRYTAALTADGQDPLWRACESQGPVVAGDRVFRTDDTYTFKEKVL